MAKAKKTGEKRVAERRDSTLSHLAGEYKDALHYTGELRRAIDSFTGSIPDDSPHRYLRHENVGEAILTYLARVGASTKSGKTIKELVEELEAGGCIFGLIKSPTEIVTKVVKAYIQSGRLVWVDRKQTIVGLPDKKG
jgi:hypothetical protein